MMINKMLTWWFKQNDVNLEPLPARLCDVKNSYIIYTYTHYFHCTARCIIVLSMQFFGKCETGTS